MENNTIRTATETREDNNGGAAEIQDNRDGIQGQELEHGGGYAGQQEWIWRRRRCGTATDEIWEDEDGEMGCKVGN